MSSSNNINDHDDKPEPKYNEIQASLFGIKGDQVDWSLIDVARVHKAIAVNDDIEAQIMKLRLLPKHLTTELSQADETSDGHFVWEQFVESIRSGLESLNSLVTKVEESKDTFHYALENISANPGIDIDPTSPDFLHRHNFTESASQNAATPVLSETVKEKDQDEEKKDKDKEHHADDSAAHEEINMDISNPQAAVAYLVEKFNTLHCRVTHDETQSVLQVHVHSMPYFDLNVDLKDLSVTVEPNRQRASQQLDGLRQAIQSYALQYLSDTIAFSKFSKHVERDESAIEGIRLIELVSMLCSYQTLFTQPCKLCNKIVNLGATLPPLFRNRSNLDFTKTIQTCPFDAFHSTCYHHHHHQQETG